jgi:nucleotide-binding universal stress UspA family protein
VTDPDPLDLRQLEHALRADDPAFLRAFDAAAAGLVHAGSDGPVVVGVDDSPAARQAVRWAARHADAVRAELRIVHAFRWRAFPDEHGRAGMHDLDGQEAAQGVARRAVELAGLVAPAVTVDARVVSRSAAAAVVGQAAGGRLVVLGAGQRTASRTALALSTLARVTASVTGPVVVVPPVEDVRSALTGRPVVVHLDGGPTSAAVLRLACEVARSQAAPVHVLCSPEVRDRVGELLTDVEVVRRTVAGDPLDALREACDGAAAVVVDRALARLHAPRRGGGARRLLAVARCPVVLTARTS